jgi:hypothetical protein
MNIIYDLILMVYYHKSSLPKAKGLCPILFPILFGSALTCPSPHPWLRILLCAELGIGSVEGYDKENWSEGPTAGVARI